MVHEVYVQCGLMFEIAIHQVSVMCQAWHYTRHVQFLVQSPQQPNGVHVSFQIRKLKAQEDKYFPKIPEPGRVELGGNPDLPASKMPALESL